MEAPKPNEPRDNWSKNDYAFWGRAVGLGGLIYFGGGYLFSVGAAVLGGGSDPRCRDGSGVAAIPLAGPLIYLGNLPAERFTDASGHTTDCTLVGAAAAYSVLSEIGQVGGLGAAILGYTWWHKAETMGAPTKVMILPGASGAQFGATLNVIGF